MTPTCGAQAKFAGKTRTCIIETDNPNHDMPGPNGASPGHYDGEYHWTHPYFGFIGPELPPPPKPEPKPPLCPECGTEITAYAEDGGDHIAYCLADNCEWEWEF